VLEKNTGTSQASVAVNLNLLQKIYKKPYYLITSLLEGAFAQPRRPEGST
jgi:hypothetical protein